MCNCWCHLSLKKALCNYTWISMLSCANSMIFLYYFCILNYCHTAKYRNNMGNSYRFLRFKPLPCQKPAHLTQESQECHELRHGHYLEQTLIQVVCTVWLSKVRALSTCFSMWLLGKLDSHGDRFLKKWHSYYNLISSIQTRGFRCYFIYRDTTASEYMEKIWKKSWVSSNNRSILILQKLWDYNMGIAPPISHYIVVGVS